VSSATTLVPPTVLVSRRPTISPALPSLVPGHGAQAPRRLPAPLCRHAAPAARWPGCCWDGSRLFLQAPRPLGCFGGLCAWSTPGARLVRLGRSAGVCGVSVDQARHLQIPIGRSPHVLLTRNTGLSLRTGAP